MSEPELTLRKEQVTPTMRQAFQLDRRAWITVRPPPGNERIRALFRSAEAELNKRHLRVDWGEDG